VAQALAGGHDEVEVTQAAEDSWIDLLLSGPGGFGILGSPDCTPGYYNNEGQPRAQDAQLLVGYPMGASAYFEYLEQWRTTGTFEGLEFR
jgi:cyclohexanone monooxygenase